MHFQALQYMSQGMSLGITSKALTTLKTQEIQERLPPISTETLDFIFLQK